MKLAEIFQDNMVLQRGKKIAVFGEGMGNISVTLCDKTTNFTSNSERFCFYLPEEEAGGPYDMTVCLDNEVKVIKNVLIGDVFMAAGQSNMELPTRDTIDIEIIENDDIRLFTEPHIPFDDGSYVIQTAEWNTATKDEILKFSAIGYKVAEILQENLHIPIGIISCNKGATRADSWTSPELTENDEYKKLNPKKEETCKMYWFNRGSWLFDNKLSPIIPFTMKGVLWYQGESNARDGDAQNYKTVLEIMIKNWRDLFSDNLPFYIVQIMPYVWGEKWHIVRKCQEEVAKTVDNVYMTTLVNTSENDQIHPQKKNTIAVMLANAVLSTLYGHDKIYSGPVYNQFNVKNNELEISFIFGGGLHFNGQPKDILLHYEDGKTDTAKCKIKRNKSK